MEVNLDAPQNPPPFQYRTPAVVERRRKRCTLPMCVIFISIVEICFYSFVVVVFTIGLTLFDSRGKLSQDRQVAKILRITVISFSGIYVLLAVILLIGCLRRIRTLVVIWICGALFLMALEWVAVVVSVALVLNGALFFISGGYGPLRLCFICMGAMYSQRLKYGKATIIPVVQHMDQGNGYRMVDNVATAIFSQPLTSNDSSTETLRLNFELSSGNDDQSLI